MYFLMFAYVHGIISCIYFGGLRNSLLSYVYLGAVSGETYNSMAQLTNSMAHPIHSTISHYIILYPQAKFAISVPYEDNFGRGVNVQL